MRFSQAFIDDLRRQADIVRIIQDYVALKKKGANWMACCPFHQEKTPSFSVNPAKGIYFCFGCQKGGSVYSFVMEIEHVPFPEAVKIVAQKTGVPLPAMQDDSRAEAGLREADEVIKLNEWALEWWESQLSDDNTAARLARGYVEARAISDETRRTFRLGYAPDSWDALSTYLKRRGASARQIEASGLVVKKETGGSYDRFRGRLMFPVMDAQGRPVAFGGRIMTPDGEPKYLNSPETAAYIKGRHLFGLNLARNEIRRRKFGILVEGYLDLIVPFQSGVRNMVASLGTALTREQARLLGRFARQVVINYDGDRAGVKATRRAMETLLAEDFDVKVLVLPDNADPDEFVRRFGVEAYHERRRQAVPFIQFALDQAVRERNLHRPADKAEAVEDVLSSVRVVRNPIQRREYFDMSMDRLRVATEQRRELWKQIQKGGGAPGAAEPSAVSTKAVRVTIAEEKLLELLLHDEEIRRVILPEIEPGDYEDLATASIFRALAEESVDRGILDFDALLAVIGDDPDASRILPQLWMSEGQRDEDEPIDEALGVAERCLNALRLMRADRQIDELGARIADAERAGDTRLRDELALEHLEWARRRNTLLPRSAAV